MPDWTLLEWLGATAALATVISVTLTGFSRLFRRTKGENFKEQAPSKSSSEATIANRSPHSAAVSSSPGAILVQGSVINSTIGYSIEAHERIVHERVNQAREDLERAHRAEIDALLQKVDALAEPEFDLDDVRAVYAALSVQNYNRAQTLLAAMEEAQIQGKVHPAQTTQVRIRTLRAEVSLLNGDTSSAVEHFEAAATLRESFDPGQGPHLRNDAGQRLSSYAAQFGGDGVARAIDLYRANLKHWTRENNPEEWAGTQHNLANAFVRLSMIETDEIAFRHLAEAESLYQAALTVRTRKTLPADWATTQFNLGAAQVSHARRLGGERATQLLESGLQSIRASLQIIDVEHSPDRWATIQHNLGAGLAMKGQRQGGQKGLKLFTEAAEAFHAALEVRTSDDNLAGWSISQFNFGSVLACQGQLMGPERGISRVLEAVAIFRKLLEVRTKESDPIGWAETQQALGGALSRIAEWHENEEGAQYADEAIQAYQDALHEFNGRSDLASSITTQLQLASALQRRATLPRVENPKELLLQAVQILHTTLDALPKTGNPSLWADGQQRLGTVLIQTSNLTEGTEEQISLLVDASSAFQSALNIITFDDQPWAWASIQENLGHIQESLGDLDPRNRIQYFRDSISAFEHALQFLDSDPIASTTEQTKTALRRVNQKLTASTE